MARVDRAPVATTYLVHCSGQDGEDECGEFEHSGHVLDNGDMQPFETEPRCPKCGRTNGFAVRLNPDSWHRVRRDKASAAPPIRGK